MLNPALGSGNSVKIENNRKVTVTMPVYYRIQLQIGTLRSAGIHMWKNDKPIIMVGNKQL